MDPLFERNLLNVNHPKDVPLDRLRVMLERDSVAFLRGIVPPNAVVRCREALRQNFQASLDRPGTGETPEELMGHFQKLSIGGAAQSGAYRPRFFRSIYCPLTQDDRYQSHAIFRRAAELRNVLYGLPIDYAIDAPDDGLWTAARFHHYPRGGGFLVSHADTVIPKVHREEGLSGFYQVIIVLSQRGIDFQSGGGFVETKGRRTYFEADAELGDIAIYDARTRHGVEDIDPDASYRPEVFEGRVAGFVTLYRDLRDQRQVAA
ncbi:MAG: hypothetical protein AAGF12_09865 [Myxococcota bacterium]